MESMHIFNHACKKNYIYIFFSNFYIKCIDDLDII